MRLRQIEVTNTPPVKQFLADQLSDTVVFAGPNAAGKTRLVGALLQFFQNPMAGAGPTSAVRLNIDATNDSERTERQKSSLDTRVPDDAQRLMRTLQKARKRSNWQSSAINFESDRTIQQVAQYVFSWAQQIPGWKILAGTPASADFAVDFRTRCTGIRFFGK